jgi:hypothetical protein
VGQDFPRGSLAGLLQVRMIADALLSFFSGRWDIA